MHILQTMRKKVLKLLGTCIFVVVIATQIDAQRIQELLQNSRLDLYILFILLFFLGVFISSIRWSLLLRAQHIPVRYSEAFRLYILGYLWNFTLPSDVGGDIVKIVAVVKEFNASKTAATAATLYDRFLGLGALCMLVVIGILINSSTIPYHGVFSLLGVIGVLLFFLFLSGLYSKPFAAILRPIAKKIKKEEFVDRIFASIDIYSKDKKTLFNTLVLALLFQTIGIINQYLAFLVIGIDIPFVFMIFAIPASRIITSLIPLSIGGVGLKEAVLTALFSAIAVSIDIVVSQSAVAYTTIIWAILLYPVIRYISSLSTR